MNKIMIVDDDRDLLVAFKGFLKTNGYDVAVTISCSEGLELLTSFKPYLVFLDINVGHEDGREMCKTIKSVAEHKHILVILMSANDEALKGYKEYGADSFIRKPIQPLHLLNVISAHLQNFG